MTVIFKKMVENVKLRQLMAKLDFLRIFQQKKNFGENLSSISYVNTFVGVSSKSTKSFSFINIKTSTLIIRTDNSAQGKNPK